jgi:hypothetical protein
MSVRTAKKDVAPVEGPKDKSFSSADTVVVRLIESACSPEGRKGLTFALQRNARVAIVANRCFRMFARAGEERLMVVSAFTTDPNDIPRTMWKPVTLEGREVLADEYTARLIHGLGVQFWIPDGVDCSEAVPGLQVCFFRPDGTEMSDEETAAAAHKMSQAAAAVYAELNGAPPERAHRFMSSPDV